MLYKLGRKFNFVTYSINGIKNHFKPVLPRAEHIPAGQMVSVFFAEKELQSGYHIQNLYPFTFFDKNSHFAWESIGNAVLYVKGISVYPYIK
jgi:hypothetical protein